MTDREMTQRADVDTVMRLVWDLVRSGPNYDGRDVEVERAIAAAIDNAVAALRKDAERYRLLRNYIVDSYIACGSGERLDAELDAAMPQPTPPATATIPAGPPPQR